MLNLDEIMNILELKKQGLSIKAIARQTGYARNTVRSVLREEYKDRKQRKIKGSILDPYKSYLKERAENPELTGTLLFTEIKSMGYPGCIDQVWRYLKSIRDEELRHSKLTVRFETPPGKQAQVDWGECGSFIDHSGKRRKLYVFVMLLGFSRDIYVEFTYSMKRPVLLQCHLNAFEFFGGFPQEILYDNMRQIKDINQNRWNAEFLDFMNYYGIIPKVCRPYRARTKGKVERAIKYVKSSFLPGRVFSSLDDANNQAMEWLNTVANVRIHAVTKERPCDLLVKENLTPVNSIAPYKIVEQISRRANFDGFVSFKNSRYSVAPEAAGKSVIIEQSQQKIKIYCNDLIVAKHKIADKPNSTVSKHEHISAMWKLTLQQSSKPKTSQSWEMLQEQQVESRSLNVYEEMSL